MKLLLSSAILAQIFSSSSTTATGEGHRLFRADRAGRLLSSKQLLSYSNPSKKNPAETTLAMMKPLRNTRQDALDRVLFPTDLGSSSNDDNNDVVEADVGLLAYEPSDQADDVTFENTYCSHYESVGFDCDCSQVAETTHMGSATCYYRSEEICFCPEMDFQKQICFWDTLNVEMEGNMTYGGSETQENEFCFYIRETYLDELYYLDFKQLCISYSYYECTMRVDGSDCDSCITKSSETGGYCFDFDCENLGSEATGTKVGSTCDNEWPLATLDFAYHEGWDNVTDACPFEGPEDYCDWLRDNHHGECDSCSVNEYTDEGYVTCSNSTEESCICPEMDLDKKICYSHSDETDMGGNIRDGGLKTTSVQNCTLIHKTFLEALEEYGYLAPSVCIRYNSDENGVLEKECEMMIQFMPCKSCTVVEAPPRGCVDYDCENLGSVATGTKNGSTCADEWPMTTVEFLAQREWNNVTDVCPFESYCHWYMDNSEGGECDCSQIDETTFMGNATCSYTNEEFCFCPEMDLERKVCYSSTDNIVVKGNVTAGGVKNISLESCTSIQETFLEESPPPLFCTYYNYNESQALLENCTMMLGGTVCNSCTTDTFSECAYYDCKNLGSKATGTKVGTTCADEYPQVTLELISQKAWDRLTDSLCPFDKGRNSSTHEPTEPPTTQEPTNETTDEPTVPPTTHEPTNETTDEPTVSPTPQEPTNETTDEPTVPPTTHEPTNETTDEPTVPPTTEPPTPGPIEPPTTPQPAKPPSDDSQYAPFFFSSVRTAMLLMVFALGL